MKQVIRAGEVYTSIGGAIAYRLDSPYILGNESGWTCTVYKNLADKFYVCMSGMVISEYGNLTELYTGRGFISNKAIGGFCKLKNDIMLLEPLEVTNAPSRN